MTPLLTAAQLEKTKTYIFSQGRLIDRQIYNFFFGSGTIQACLDALKASQNPDGGFGNGLEPDLSCPDSTAIGAETAMYVLQLLDIQKTEVIKGLVRWITTNQNADGYIDHPPKSLFNYPHQRWWETPDKERILALAGLLKKWGYEDRAFFDKVRAFYLNISLTEKDIFYSYPQLIYLKYCASNSDEKAKLSTLLECLPTMLEVRRNYFPLFNRMWFYIGDYVGKSTLAEAAMDVVAAFQEDGGIANPYPDLPWWRAINTVDSLVLLKKMNYL